MKQISISDIFTKKRKNIRDEDHHKRPCSIDKQISGDGAMVSESPDRFYDDSPKLEDYESVSKRYRNEYRE